MNPVDREKFERDYAEEFRAYEKENEPKPFIVRFKERPIKHLALFSLLCLSGIRVPGWISTQPGYQSVFCVLVGIFLADFLTGFIHMWCDMTPLEPVTVERRSPAQWSAFGFHYHHANMQNWNDNDIWYGAIVRAGFMFYVPIMVLCLVFDEHRLASPATCLILYACAHSGLLTQIFHAAAHGRWNSHPMLGRLITWLQALRLVLPPSVHRDHHKYFDRNFAILTGWSNFILNWIFRTFFLERLDKGVSPEEQRRVYYEEKSRVVWPYYQIFPKWRESAGF